MKRRVRTAIATAALLTAAGGGASARATSEPPESSAEASGSTAPEEGPDTTETCQTEEPTESTEASESTTTEIVEPVIDPGDGGDYAPDVDPANFVDTIDNPYLPLSPGSRWVYEGETDEGVERTEVEVLDEHRDVMGISAVVVRDTVSLDGEIIEDTYDWFAQDAAGTVWYLGEDSTSYECGEPVSTEGSWEAGVDGALPGIVMPAEPEAGFSYRQEFLEGEAEDLGRIEEVGVARSIGIGDYDDVVVTTDWNPFEPDVVEQKWYARDVGMIYEEHIAGGDETSELIEFTPGD
jgi:hypothetical protein